jgi:hypothetical protein
MKMFTFFMAFYILVLSAIPCSDMHNECRDTNTKTELTQNHDHQQDQDDNCSPFCICSCCNANATVFNLSPFQIKAPTFFPASQKVTLRNFSFVSNYFGNIWQPPKISA